MFRTDLIGGHGKGFNIPGHGKADVFVDGNIYELKPNNAKSILKCIKQLHRYNAGLGYGNKLVLVVY